MSPPDPPRLDRIGWYIAESHRLLGHDTAAAVLGQPRGDKAACLLCQYEANPTTRRRLAVIAAIGQPSAPDWARPGGS